MIKIPIGNWIKQECSKGHCFWYKTNNLILKVNFFPDGTSVSSIANYINVSAEEINNDLKRISEWAFNGKWCSTLILPNMIKNLFFLENSETFSPQVFFNKVPVEPSVSQKHLGLHLDQKLDISKHINEKISKIL